MLGLKTTSNRWSRDVYAFSCFSVEYGLQFLMHYAVHHDRRMLQDGIRPSSQSRTQFSYHYIQRLSSLLQFFRRADLLCWLLSSGTSDYTSVPVLLSSPKVRGLQLLPLACLEDQGG